MNEKKSDKKYIITQCLAYIAIVGLRYWIDAKTENQKWNQVLNYMDKHGLTMKNIVDGKEYVCSVTEIK